MKKKDVFAALIWLVLLGLAAGLHLTSVSSEFGGSFGGDNVTYYLLAQALALGEGYVDLYLPGHPPHTKYPFLLPLLLAPFHLLFRHPLLPMHVFLSLLNLAGLALLARLVLRRSQLQSRLFLVLMFFLLPRLYLQGSYLLSEPLYTFCFALALTLTPPPQEKRLSLSRFGGLTASVLATFFTRTTGATLAAALIFLLWRKKIDLGSHRRELPAGALLAVVFLAAALTWMVRNYLAGGTALEYANQFFLRNPYEIERGRAGLLDFLHRGIKGIEYYPPLIGRYFYSLSSDYPWTGWAATILDYSFFALSAVGLCFGLKRREPGAFFVLFSLALVLLWPYQEERFIVPLLPLFLSSFFLALEQGPRLTARWPLKRGLLVCICLLLLAGQAGTTVRLLKSRLKDGWEPKGAVPVKGYGLWEIPVVNWAKYDVLYGDEKLCRRPYIAGLTHYQIINRVAARLAPPQAIFMSRLPMFTYYWTGRQCVPMLHDSRPEKQWEYILSHRVDYVITGLGGEKFSLALKHWPERFQLIAEIEYTEAAVYKVVRPAWPE